MLFRLAKLLNIFLFLTLLFQFCPYHCELNSFLGLVKNKNSFGCESCNSCNTHIIQVGNNLVVSLTSNSPSIHKTIDFHKIQYSSVSLEAIFEEVVSCRYYFEYHIYEYLTFDKLYYLRSPPTLC